MTQALKGRKLMLVGFTLFSMFFGAGNLIFPPDLGAKAGANLWPAFLGSPPNRMGIIDAVSVDHTRPIGATYSVQSAVVEQSHIFRTYGFTYAKIAGVK